MQLHHERHGDYLLIRARGRLDASWSELFSDTLLRHIREGQHRLLVTGDEIEFLSSAGIRALLLVYKELRSVHGSFAIVDPCEFVRKTLAATGFAEWLRDDYPDDFPADADADAGPAGDGPTECHVMHPNATLTLQHIDRLFSGNGNAAEASERVRLGTDTFGLGIGAAGNPGADGGPCAGEFVAAAGHVVVQPPDERSRPDYLIAENDYVPELSCLQALRAEGKPSMQFRFSPSEERPVNDLGSILNTACDILNHDVVGVVILGEIEGLVGATLVGSLDGTGRAAALAWPAVRDRLSFCGERSFAHEQALVAGIVARNEAVRSCPGLFPMPSQPQLAVHLHAAVFPYQPLPNGKLAWAATVRRFFGGPAPRAVMHLLDDVRPGVGLGGSALVRGACWCGPVANPEVLT